MRRIDPPPSTSYKRGQPPPLPSCSPQPTKPVTQQTKEEHHLKLYSISELPYPSEENLDISIRVDFTNSTSTNATIKVCCGKPREEQHGDEHPYLLKALTYGHPLEQVTIIYNGHTGRNCTCTCHQPTTYVPATKRKKKKY
jgi:hypothetical protein